MKALKGLLIYIGIVLAIILGIGVFLFCLMYFIPSMRIFGAGVVHANSAGEKQVIELEDYSNYDKIELNLSSKKINVVLKADPKLDDIKYALDLNCFGLAFDITEYRIIKDVSLENKVLSIDLNVTEPNGWISCYGSEMIVYVPANLTYDVLVKTESGSVTLGDDKNVLQMNSLVANTTTGSLYVNKVSATDTLKLKALSLTTNSGNMDLSNIKNVNVSSKVVIYAKSGEFSFHNLNADIDVRGTGVRLVANSIKSTSAGLTFMSKDGYFKVKDLISVGSAESTIVTENCNITIDKVVGNAGIVTTYGNININKAENDLILESTHGDIKVKEARGDLRATSSFGNINCDGYYKNGVFINKRGNIKVESKGDYAYGVFTKIENQDGKVVLRNKVNKVLVYLKGRSSAEVTFLEVKTGLTIETTHRNEINTGSSGKCEVYLPSIMPSNTYFKFKATGNVSGEISGLTPEYEGSEVRPSLKDQFYPNVSYQDRWFESCSFVFDGNIVLKPMM